MTPFTTLSAVVAPLIRANVDTDAIIPSREMKSVSKTGLSAGLFAGWRYTEIGGREPNPDFVLNKPAYAGAQILLGGDNFGCGSSREHAVWALAEYGFRAVIAPSFNPIFRGNCVRNGLAPIELAEADIARIASEIEADPQARLLTIDLAGQTVTTPAGISFGFSIEPEAKTMLLNGYDAIDLTLTRASEIEAFRAADRERRPWAYFDV